MQIISYAQNFEDVILWRALKHVERGFYIDVGAQDPVINSVSLAFYEKGWRGVHVEPTKFYARQASCGASRRKGGSGGSLARNVVTFHSGNCPILRLSIGDPTIAKLYRDRTCSEIDVAACGCLNFWSITARGNPLAQNRCRKEWSCRVELAVRQSTALDLGRRTARYQRLPESALKASCESIIVELGYEFVYFDRINRFNVQLTLNSKPR